MSKRGNNEGSIYQRKDGIWCASASLGHSPVTGKAMRKTVYAKTRKEAADKLRGLLDSVANKTPIARRDITIETLIGEFLQEVKPNLRPNTYKSYAHLCGLYVTPKLGKVKVADLDAKMVSAWQRGLIESGGEAHGALSARTVTLARACLKQALDQAVRWDYISRNVVPLTSAPGGSRRASPNLSKADASAILTAFDGDVDYPLVVVLLGLGLRIGEALALRWQDLAQVGEGSEAHLRVTIRHQLAHAEGGRDGKRVLQAPKTSKGVRSIAVPGFVAQALEARKLAQEAQQSACGDAWNNELGLIFTTGNGGPRGYANVWARYKRVLRRAGIEGVTLHDLRHLCAALLVSKGVHPRIIMGILGHSRIAITMEIYAQVMPGVDVAAAHALDSVFSEP